MISGRRCRASGPPLSPHSRRAQARVITNSVRGRPHPAGLAPNRRSSDRVARPGRARGAARPGVGGGHGPGDGRLDHRLAPTPAFRGTHPTSWSSRRHGSPPRRPHPWGRHDHEKSAWRAVPDPDRQADRARTRPPAHSTRTPRPPFWDGAELANYRTPWSRGRPSPTHWHARSRRDRPCGVPLNRRWSRCRPRRPDTRSTAVVPSDEGTGGRRAVRYVGVAG